MFNQFAFLNTIGSLVHFLAFKWILNTCLICIFSMCRNNMLFLLQYFISWAVANVLKYVNDITLVILIGSANLLAPSASLVGVFLGKKKKNEKAFAI